MRTLITKKKISNKKEKKNATKKISKNRKTLMLKLDNDVEIPARIAYMKGNNKCRKVDEIDVNKLYTKEHNSYNLLKFVWV